jgi:hypothetical protein
LNP